MSANRDVTRKSSQSRRFPLPKLRCPVCSKDIDVSAAKGASRLSICHGWVVLTPVPGTLICTVDFYSELPDSGA